MPWPKDHGPDIHGVYQQLTGEPVPNWPLFSHKISEGANSGDKGFPTRWPWMREQGFKYRGAYHWLRSDSSISAQAANVIRRLDALDGLLIGEFIQSDWETTPGIYIPSAKGEREFCDRLHQHYQRECTITYSSDWIPDSPEDSDNIGEFYNWLDFTQGKAALWYANYNTDPNNPRGGQQECARYGADVWQFTSSFFHPSIYSPSVGRPEGRGFDMNHVFNFATLDRIAGYQAQPQTEGKMKAILYTVNSPDPNIGGAWFYVSPERKVSQVRNGEEYGIWVAAGALPRNAESLGHFIEQLSTFKPLGALGSQGQLVLGAIASADWNARANSSVTVNPVVTVTTPGMTGTIDLKPK